MNKYGKSYMQIMQFKQSFYEDNNKWLEISDRLVDIYKKQPKRTQCKICGSNIETSNKHFESHSVKYIVCPECGHINGEYQDTYELSQEIYQKTDYGALYSEPDKAAYNERRKEIYIPKAEFLLDVIQESTTDSASSLKFLDVGAGSGYFVSALRKLGMDAKGIEISREQVNFANKINSTNIIEQCDTENVCHTILTTKAQIISFIGVLEHVINLHEVLSAVNKNPYIKYVFFSVPMFSYSVILEVLNEKIFNMHLGGMAAHTHVFSNESLKRMLDDYHWNTLGKWVFGADAADFMRMTLINLREKNESYLSELFFEKYQKILDKIQYAVDCSEFASEIHIVAEKK